MYLDSSDSVSEFVRPAQVGQMDGTVLEYVQQACDSRLPRCVQHRLPTLLRSIPHCSRRLTSLPNRVLPVAKFNNMLYGKAVATGSSHETQTQAA